MRKNNILLLIVLFLFFTIAFYFGKNYLSNKPQPLLKTEIPEVTSKIISTDHQSPDGTFIVKEETAGDYAMISIADSTGQVIMDDLVTKNYKEIGCGEKIEPMCGYSFKGWTDGSHFVLRVSGGLGEYEYLVDASSGKVIESTFRTIETYKPIQ